MNKKDKPQNNCNKKLTPDKVNNKKINKFYKEQEIKGDGNMENTIEREERPCTVAESLKQSLKEMKLIREGKMSRRNLDDFLEELEKEIHDEE